MTTQDLTLSWHETLVEKADEPDMKFTDDPVALAWASYRTFLSHPGARWTDFDDVTVIDQDRTMAQDIRSYYTGRILMDMMKSNNGLSDFRKKLYGLLIGETGLKKKDIGLLYRLPYFYVEDTALDEVIAQTAPAKSLQRSYDITGTFTLLKEIQISRRSGEYVQFWLKHNTAPEPFMIACKSDNPLLPLLKSVLAAPAKLEAVAFVKNHRGHHRNREYYQLGNVVLCNG